MSAWYKTHEISTLKAIQTVPETPRAPERHAESVSDIRFVQNGRFVVQNSSFMVQQFIFLCFNCFFVLQSSAWYIILHCTLLYLLGGLVGAPRGLHRAGQGLVEVPRVQGVT